MVKRGQSQVHGVIKSDELWDTKKDLKYKLFIKITPNQITNHFTTKSHGW